jgi:hypothetical protein
VVVQLDELERNKMAPVASPIMLNKWQNSAVYARFFGCIAMRSEPPKLRAGGVGVAGSNPVVPTNFSSHIFGVFHLHGAGCARLRFSLSYNEPYWLF